MALGRNRAGILALLLCAAVAIFAFETSASASPSATTAKAKCKKKKNKKKKKCRKKKTTSTGGSPSAPVETTYELSIDPTVWNFGTASSSKAFTVTNVGSGATGALQSEVGTDTGSPFVTFAKSGPDTCTGATLAPGLQCTITAADNYIAGTGTGHVTITDPAHGTFVTAGLFASP